MSSRPGSRRGSVVSSQQPVGTGTPLTGRRRGSILVTARRISISPSTPLLPSSSSPKSSSAAEEILSVSQSLSDRKKRGEAGMSVLKWKLSSLQGKTRERERALQGDRDDIELIADDAAPEDKKADEAECREKRQGMRERLTASQVMRGKEIRRAEMRRKKSRRVSDDEEKEQDDDDTASTAGLSSTRWKADGADDAAAAGRRSQSPGGGAERKEGEEVTPVRGTNRREEEMKQQPTEGDRADGQSDFLSALHGDKEAPPDDSDDDKRRRRDRYDFQALKAALDAVERQRKTAFQLPTSTVSLSQQLQKQRRTDRPVGASGLPASHRRRRSSISGFAILRGLPSARTSGRASTRDAPVTTLAGALTARSRSASMSLSRSSADPSDFPAFPLSVSSVTYALSSRPPLSLPVVPCLSRAVGFVSFGAFKARAGQFRSLFECPSAVSLVSSLFWYCHAHSFQNDAAPELSALLVDISRHYSRWRQLLDLTLRLHSSAYPHPDDGGDEGALYRHLLTLLPAAVGGPSAPSLSSSTVASYTRSGGNPVRDRALTCFPLLLSSAVFCLFCSLFTLSRELLTLRFLHHLDAIIVEMMLGFPMTASTLRKLRTQWLQDRKVDDYRIGSASSIGSTGGDDAPDGDKQKDKAGKAGDGSGGDGLATHGDWARDEKERREEVERRRSQSASTPSSSSLSAEYIRRDPTLLPYQRHLLLSLLSPPSHAHQLTINANTLTPLLSVGLHRTTPDSSWRREHRVKYIVPADKPAPAAGHRGGVRWGETAYERWKAKADGRKRTGLRLKVVMQHDNSTTLTTARGGRTDRERLGTPGAAAGGPRSAPGDRERVQEGDPLSVLTARTRRLVAEYSSRDEQPAAAAAAATGNTSSAGRTKADGGGAAASSSSGLLTVSAAAGTGHGGGAQNILSLDLRAVRSGRPGRGSRRPSVTGGSSGVSSARPGSAGQ